MPTHSRIHRAEAKYNVTTEFPHLGLHAAAATGNVGLVKYALSHGQPVNSVLDGVLPLHAACSGGNDFVVRLLIEQGADVNAPRLPRRYSDRNRDTAAPIVGTSGSTPLHFAAANGHSMVIRTLLLNGAHADQPDKHGVTPQTLARQNGWVECADVLQEWLANQERSLRERGESPASGEAQQFRGRSSSSGAMECIETSIRKRLHLKRSIDHALNVLRPSGTPDPEINPLPMQISLSEDFSSNHAHSSSLEQYALHNASPSFPEDSSSPRRPSFPHVFDESLRRPSTSSLHTRVSRPRSAGTGAESAPPIRKLNSKLSLLSLFKKSNADGSSSSVTSEHNSSASSIPLPTPSPASGSIPLPVSPRSITAPLSSSPKDFPSIEQHRRRIGSNSSARSHLPIAMELYPGQQSRNRSASGGSRASMTPNEDLQSEAASPPIRPGILRLHNRSSSSGQSQGQASTPQSSSRIIRFDPSSSTSSLSGRTRSPGSRYVGTNQTLETRYRSNTLEAAEDRFGIAPTPIEEHSIMLDPQPPNSAPPIIVGMADDDADDDAEDFGVPINRQTDSQRPKEPRGRKISASLSPPLFQSSKPLHVHNSDFPFNINEPPPSDDITATHPPHESPRQRENRLRGESVSSTSTDSYNPQSSGSSATWTSNGGSVTTPNTPYLTLSSPYIASNSLGRLGPDSPRSPKPPMSPGRQVKSPLEIDIQSISSHAQAEELVQRTQQSILSMDDFVADVPKPKGAGRTLLSSKLLAYGESLAIERRLKEQEDAKTSLSIPSPSIDQFSAGRTPTSGYDSTQFVRGHSARAMSRSQSAGKLRVGSRGSSGSDSSSETASRLIVVPGLRRPSRSASDELHSMDRPTGQVFSSGNAFLAPRSRTPDPESSPLETEGPIMHVPLSRVATAPVQVSLSAHIPSRRRGNDQAKHIMSANKLTRMGFSTSDGWQPPPSGGPTRPPTKHKFGGIRTLMQTFQGK